MRQVEDEEMGLLLDAIEDHHGFAEIRLRIPRRVGQRHKHFTSTALTLPDIVLDDQPQQLQNRPTWLAVKPKVVDALHTVLYLPYSDDSHNPS